MAKLLHDNIQVLGAWLDSMAPSLPGATAVHFDSHTNLELFGAASSMPFLFSVIDGVLTRDGAPVVINPPCDDCAALDALDGATTVAQLRKVLLVMRDKPGFTRG